MKTEIIPPRPARILYFLFLLSTFSFASFSSASEYHVAADAPGASDNSPGTLEQPWRTLARAGATAQAGDTVYIHAGTYPESVSIKNAGSPGKPIVFKAFGDDAVIMDGADTIPSGRWKELRGRVNISWTAAQGDPWQVFIDGKAVYTKFDKVSKFLWNYGMLAGLSPDRYQYDPENKRLYLNVGGKPEEHHLRVPVRDSAITLNAYCRVAGIRAVNYKGSAFYVTGDDAVVEDCAVVDCAYGIVVAGQDRRGVIVRRNTVIGALANGIYLQDRPTGCQVEDNLVVRCSLNPSANDDWFGSIKMNSAADTVFAHNVVLESGNPETRGGHDGMAFWGDINITRVFYQGNTAANNKEAGYYIEYMMGDTRAYYNTSYKNGYGITCSASQRGMFMWNLILSSKSSGLAIWAGNPPSTTTDNVFAHNLVRDCDPSIWFQTEQPNFADYNIYWPRKGSDVAWGEAPKKGSPTPHYKTLKDWSGKTGHDLHSEVRDAQPEALGLDTVTFRVPDARDPSEVLMMIGNAGCEHEDPSGQNILPYFWRPGTGDGAEHQLLYDVYNDLYGRAFSFGGSGGLITYPLDSDAPDREKLAHGGRRCLRIEGLKPQAICGEGLGFWSPTLPARAGDTLAIGFYARGRRLKPSGGTKAVSAFVEFTDATGQHRSKAEIRADRRGTFDWKEFQGEVKVPEGAKRMRLFLGLLPATGDLLLDDISIKVKEM